MTKEKRETDDVAIDGYMGPELKKEIIKEIQNRIQDPTRRSSCFIYEESILDVNLSTQSLVVSLLTNMNLNSKPTLVCIKLTPNQEVNPQHQLTNKDLLKLCKIEGRSCCFNQDERLCRNCKASGTK